MIGDEFLEQMRNFKLIMEDLTPWTSCCIKVENTWKAMSTYKAVYPEA